MKLKLVLIMATAVFLFSSLFALVRCDAPLIDQTATVTGQDPYAKSYYANLTGGDRVSMNIAVTGDPIRLGIYATIDGRIYFKVNITSLNEEWTAPHNDTFEFRIDATEGTSTFHVVVQKAGGGFDPLTAVVIVVVVVVVLLAVVLALRMRKRRPQAPMPPPPPSST
jgi:hypothetical protein